MESTYPEIYMNPWQEMRQMQKREEGKWQGESCQVRMTLARSSCMGKFGANGDRCRGRGGGGVMTTDGDDGAGGRGVGGGAECVHHPQLL